MARLVYLWFMILLVGSLCAQELKTYNGRYNINGFEGRATYQYKDAPDGTRIFHGYFSFEAEDNEYDSQNVTVNGEFRDNHQSGTWTWKGCWDLGFRNENQIFTYTFDNDGNLDGKATYQGGSDDAYELIIKKDRIFGEVPFTSDNGAEIIEATWENGHLVGDYRVRKLGWIDEDYGEVKGIVEETKGQFDNNGTPYGIWTVKTRQADGEIRQHFYTLDAEGKTIDGYYIDESTGDKIPCYERFHKVSFIPALFRKRADYLLRDSKKKFLSSEISHEEEKLIENENIFVAVEQSAMFPGGPAALYKWLSSNQNYPPEAAENDIQGRVIVKFVVGEDGSISHAQIAKGVNHDLDCEALRVVKSMPRWQPAKNNGHPVSSWYSLPIVFKLQH